MSHQLRPVMTLYAVGVIVVSLIGIAFAEDGVACAATWQKTLFPNGTAVFSLYCVPTGCPEPCVQTGQAGFGSQYSTCRCPGQFIYCNAAIRNIAGWSSEEQCLGGCTQASTELCPDVEEDPWTLVGWNGDIPTFEFECDCVAAG